MLGRALKWVYKRILILGFIYAILEVKIKRYINIIK